MKIKPLEKVSEFISEQEPETAYKLADLLESFQNSSFDNLVRTQVIKKIKGKDGLYEVRLWVIREKYRFLGNFKDEILYLTVPFKKRSKKIPPRKIYLATKIMKGMFIYKK